MTTTTYIKHDDLLDAIEEIDRKIDEETELGSDSDCDAGFVINYFDDYGTTYADLNFYIYPLPGCSFCTRQSPHDIAVEFNLIQEWLEEAELDGNIIVVDYDGPYC